MVSLWKSAALGRHITSWNKVNQIMENKNAKIISTQRKTAHREKNAALVDVLDKVVSKGAYLEGDIIFELADIDLLFIKLKLIVGSTSHLSGKSSQRETAKEDTIYIEKMKEHIKKIEQNINVLTRLDSPEKAEKGIAKLVLTLIELIRQLLEREAVRKIDRGELTDTQIEKAGLTFKALEKKMEELKKIFGIEDELNLDLGPIGKLL